MLGLLKWCISTILVVAILVLALINLHFVELTYSPFHAPIEMPLALIIGIFSGCGFFAGGLLVWFQYGPFSKRAFANYHRQKELKKEIDKKHRPANTLNNLQITASK